MYKYFESVTDSLELFEWPMPLWQGNLNIIDSIIQKFSFHPSIIQIKSNIVIKNKFCFQPVNESIVKTVIDNLSLQKSISGEIPTFLIKRCDFIFEKLSSCINESFNNNKFPDSLKLSEIIPIHKKDDPTDKTNFRPFSILPLLSKVFEKIMYDQLYEYIEKFLNMLLCGFRKAHSAQHAFFRLIQSWESELDQNGFVGTILMDLSKAYDCLSHDLIVAKLEAYGLSRPSLLLMQDYLSFRKQRTKVGSYYSNWSEIDRGIPQGSILGPLLFNVFINDIFLFVEKSMICNFADDNTLYSCNKNINNVKENLIFDIGKLL